MLRGPATLRYGSAAIGGAVNVVDGRIPANRAAKTFGGRIDLVGGSVAGERTAALQLNGGGGEWAWHIGAVSRQTDPYEIPGYARLDDEHEEHEDQEEHEEENSFGTVPNTDLTTESGRFGFTRFFGDRGFLGVAFSGFSTDYGIPTGAHNHAGHDHGGDHHGEDEHHDGDIRLDMKQQRIDLGSSVQLPAAAFERLEVQMSGTDYEHVEFESGQTGVLYTNDLFETRVEMFQRERGASRGSVGLQYVNRDLVALGAEAFIPPTRSNTWAAFTSQEVERGSVRWQFGARFEQAEHDPASGPAWSGDGVSASAYPPGPSTSAIPIWTRKSAPVWTSPCARKRELSRAS